MTTLREKLGRKARCHAKSSNTISALQSDPEGFFHNKKVCTMSPLGIYFLVLGWTLFGFFAGLCIGLVMDR